jgi:eukaryotic-like serine/threonine-protein kinase
MIAGRYAPIGRSVSGGMGDISEFEDTHLQRRVMIKTMRDGEEEARLLDEQKALLRLRSKHVIQLFDVIKLPTNNGSKPALVLEYIDGQNLDELKFAQNADYLKTLWQVACGLSEIHDAGVIHRDIKPNNIRMDGEKVVKILDFGLSRNEGKDAKTKSVIGTLGFMAPELWGTATISFDNAIDVYAFGITALHLLGIAGPKYLYESPPLPLKPNSLHSLLSQLPPDLVETLEACLAYDPKARPKMRAVAHVLSRHLLKGRHRALLIAQNQMFEVNANNRTASVKFGAIGSITIAYDDFSFPVTAVNGTVSINNMAAAVGQTIEGCCVITFGVPGGQRAFATFDISNPEVLA